MSPSVLLSLAEVGYVSVATRISSSLHVTYFNLIPSAFIAKPVKSARSRQYSLWMKVTKFGFVFFSLLFYLSILLSLFVIFTCFYAILSFLTFIQKLFCFLPLFIHFFLFSFLISKFEFTLFFVKSTFPSIFFLSVFVSFYSLFTFLLF